MRTHRRKSKPQVEPLESLTLLSGLPALAGVHPPSAEVHAAAAARRVVLNATTRGFYSASRGIPDTGQTDNVFTVGRAHGLGAVAVTGSLTSVGFIQQGHATGTLTVRTARGNLTLGVTGPTQPGFSPLPTRFTFTVLGGTGRFRNATGSGTLTVSLRPDPLNVGTPDGNTHGAVTMTFRPGRVFLV